MTPVRRGSGSPRGWHRLRAAPRAPPDPQRQRRALSEIGVGAGGDAPPPHLFLGSHPAPRAAPAGSAAPAPPGRPPRGAYTALGGSALPATPRLAPRSPAEGYVATGAPGTGHEAFPPAARRGRALPTVPGHPAAAPTAPRTSRDHRGRGALDYLTAQPYHGAASCPSASRTSCQLRTAAVRAGPLSPAPRGPPLLRPAPLAELPLHAP